MPDGTVYPLTTKPSDLTDVKSKYFQRNDMVFTLPNVEVGSIIEYKLQIRYDDEWISSPEWTIQQPYFVHKAHYFFQPSQRWWHGVMWASHVKPGTKVVTDSQGRYTYDVEDVPAVPDEDWMPPLNSLNLQGPVLLRRVPRRAGVLAGAGQGMGQGHGEVRRRR